MVAVSSSPKQTNLSRLSELQKAFFSGNRTQTVFEVVAFVSVMNVLYETRQLCPLCRFLILPSFRATGNVLAANQTQDNSLLFLESSVFLLANRQISSRAKTEYTNVQTNTHRLKLEMSRRFIKRPQCPSHVRSSNRCNVGITGGKKSKIGMMEWLRIFRVKFHPNSSNNSKPNSDTDTWTHGDAGQLAEEGLVLQNFCTFTLPCFDLGVLQVRTKFLNVL